MHSSSISNIIKILWGLLLLWVIRLVILLYELINPNEISFWLSSTGLNYYEMHLNLSFVLKVLYYLILELSPLVLCIVLIIALKRIMTSLDNFDSELKSRISNLEKNQRKP